MTIQAGILTFGLGSVGTGTGGGTVVVQDIVGTIWVENSIFGIIEEEEAPTGFITVEPVLIAGTISVETALRGTIRGEDALVGYILKEEGGVWVSDTANVTMYRGNDRSLRASINAEGTGDPTDLTGAKVWFTVKERLSDLDAAAVIQKKNTAAGGSAAEIEIVDAPGGQVLIYIDPEDTDAVPAATYSFDVKVELGSGKYYTPIRGKITFKEGVTKTR